MSSPSRRELWVRLLLYPGHTLPTAAAPVVVGTGLAIHDGVFAALPALLAFLGSWLIHLGGVLADNHELLRRHPGVPEHPELLAAVAEGRLDLPRLRAIALACFAAGALPGLYLVTLGGLPVIALGVVGVLASLAYAGGPRPYARRGLADPIFFAMFGVAAVAGTYYIQAASRMEWSWLPAPGTLPLPAFLVGLPVGALVTNVLVIDDIRDRDFDAAKGWRTGAVRFGLRWSRTEFAALSVFAYLAPFGFWSWLGFDAWVLLPLLTLPEALEAVRAVRTHDSTPELLSWTPRTSRLSLLYALLLASGMALSRG